MHFLERVSARYAVVIELKIIVIDLFLNKISKIFEINKINESKNFIQDGKNLSRVFLDF